MFRYLSCKSKRLQGSRFKKHAYSSHDRKVLVIGNYFADQQQSMIRFANLLQRIYSQNGDVTLASPPCLVAGLPGLPEVFRKYLAYIDKLILFPVWLYLRTPNFALVHIADHSNAFYSYFSPRGRCIITCHDLLAVRGALGDPAVACDASPIGIWLQRLIMAGLRRADGVVFDSHSTFLDFQRLISASPRQRHAVIPIPLNAPFTKDPETLPITLAEKAQIPEKPYLLMVGSALPRKNRGLALHLIQLLGPTSPYMVVFAGESLTPEEETFRITHPLGARLISIARPTHAILNHLYCQAHALLFPSFAEGFGWPLLEAQTCCCPVIASPTTSIPEVAGDGALYADPTDVSTFQRHVLALEDPAERSRLINLGLTNTLRFTTEVIAEAYRSFAFQL